MILQPKRFWKEQKSKKPTKAQLLAGYFIPLTLVAAFGVFLGEFLKGSNFYFSFAVLKALRKILLFGIVYSVTLFFADELRKNFGGTKNTAESRKLVVYSMTPLFLVSAVTGLFPFFYVLDILGFYGFYLFWIGAKELVPLPGEKQSSYITLTLTATLVSFIIFSIILSKLLTTFV